MQRRLTSAAPQRCQWAQSMRWAYDILMLSGTQRLPRWCTWSRASRVGLAARAAETVLMCGVPSGGFAAPSNSYDQCQAGLMACLNGHSLLDSLGHPDERAEL